MSEKDQLRELQDVGECLIMLGEAIKNHARSGKLEDAKTALNGAKIVAPEIIRETAEKIG